MRLTYYGHAAFLVEAADGTRIIMDPYLSGAFGGSFAYAPIDEPADLVLATHEHDDHGAVDTIPGHPRVFIHPVRRDLPRRPRPRDTRRARSRRGEEDGGRTRSSWWMTAGCAWPTWGTWATNWTCRRAARWGEWTSS